LSETVIPPVKKLKHEVLSKKNETHQHLKKLLDMTRPDDSLLLLMYGSPDPDAIASAMALKEILERKKGLSRSAFASTEPFRRQQNKELARTMRISIRLLNQIDKEAYRLIALVDAQPSFFGDQPHGVVPNIVFDHHPRKGDWQAELSDIRPQYGALSTMMTEYLLAAGLRIPRNLHTALLYGIKTDTDNFDRDTIAEDIAAYTYHSKRANMRLIRRIELDQTPASFLKYFEIAYRRMKYYRGRRVGFLGPVESPDVCVQVADFYLRLIGTYYVVVAGIVNDKLVIIFRGDGYRQDCGAVAQKACGLLGQGGGHRSAARIEIALDVLKTELKGDVSQQSIEKFLTACLKQDLRIQPETHTIKPEKDDV
jgi:nanoRNase/pAp phosphatase (c-di-AMP/oligoRNAs hydrolase)